MLVDDVVDDAAQADTGYPMKTVGTIEPSSGGRVGRGSGTEFGIGVEVTTSGVLLATGSASPEDIKLIRRTNTPMTPCPCN